MMSLMTNIKTSTENRILIVLMIILEDIFDAIFHNGIYNNCYLARYL